MLSMDWAEAEWQARFKVGRKPRNSDEGVLRMHNVLQSHAAIDIWVTTFMSNVPDGVSLHSRTCISCPHRQR